MILIFSVNMSGHFQGYAQMVSPIGQHRANVWSEASWGGTFSVEWIQLYDLPFQKTLHLKNPLNSFKPVKISRDCQVYTTLYCVHVDLCMYMGILIFTVNYCRNLPKKLVRLYVA